MAGCCEHAACSGSVKGWKFLLIGDIPLLYVNCRKEADCQPQLKSLSFFIACYMMAFLKGKTYSEQKELMMCASFLL